MSETQAAAPVDLARLEELAEKIERQCNAADRRAVRRCIARAEVRLDALELRPLIAAARAVERVREVRACLGAGPMDYEAFVDEVDEILAALGGAE